MKQTNIRLSLAVAVAVAVCGVFASCEKDEGEPPGLDMKTGGIYTSSDAVVAQNTSVTFGINANRTEKKDDLKRFNVSVSYDGAADSTVLNEDVPEANAESYSKDITITTRNKNGTEKWSFTITNRDGISNRKTVTLTVQ